MGATPQCHSKQVSRQKPLLSDMASARCRHGVNHATPGVCCGAQSADHASTDGVVLMKRRSLMLALPALAATAHLPARPQALPTLEVWKDPNCGCCKDWIAHLEQARFRVRSHDSGNTAARQRLGLAP